MAKLRSLELGRFIAAMLVMLSHAAPYVNAHGAGPMFGGLLFPGPLGVQYFFVLSGFVMASAHHADFGRLAAVPQFWWRRACRIYPAYWLALCIPVFYLYKATTLGIALHMVLLDPWYGQEYIPATWSLRLEMAFYIMFGLCLLPYIGRLLLGGWAFLTLWIWVLAAIAPFHPPLLGTLVHLSLRHAADFFSLFEVYFFAGLAAGYAYVKCRFTWRIWAGLLVAGGLLFARLLPMEGWGVLYGSHPSFVLGMAAALAVLLLGLAGLERAGGFRLGRWAGWLGAISYPVYIFHEPVMLVITNELHWGQYGTIGLYTHFALLCGAILGLSALVTFLFDQPVQRALRRLTRRIWRQPGPGLTPLYSSNPGH